MKNEQKRLRQSQAANKKVERAVALLAEAAHLAEDLEDLYAAGSLDTLVLAVRNAEPVVHDAAKEGERE